MTSMQLGGAFGLRGLRTKIVDMDQQGTSLIWFAQAKPEKPFPADVETLAPLKDQMIRLIGKCAEDYDIIIIDCPPAIESSIPWAALNIADVGLIPVIPVLDNVWASNKARELAIRAKQENPTLKTYYIGSMLRRGNLFKGCMALLQSDKEVPMLKSTLSMRNAFPESQLDGTTVHSFGRNTPATLEVEALADELLGIVGLEMEN